MTRYLIRSEDSTVTIEVGTSVHTMRHSANGLAGWVEIDDGRVHGGEVSFPVKNLRSGNPLQDRELHRRIDARRHPTITGRVTAAAELVTGQITFRGVSRPVTDRLDVEVGEEVRVTGSTALDIRNWQFDPPRILLLKVSPHVVVSIDVRAHRDGQS